MKHGMDNEEGIAYAMFMILTLLILGALIWITLTFAFNLAVTDVINPRIDAGLVSTQTVAPMQFGLSLLGIVPILLLLGVFIWAVLAAIIKKVTGG